MAEAKETAYNEIIDEFFTLFNSHFPKSSINSLADGDVDAVVNAILSESETSQGCVVNYVNSTRVPNDKSFYSWDHLFGGVYLIRLEHLDTIEEEKRKVISRLWSFSDSVKSQTLSGKVKQAQINLVERAREADINDMPFYLVPFSVTVRDRRR